MARERIAGKPISAVFAYWIGTFPGVLWWRRQIRSGELVVRSPGREERIANTNRPYEAEDRAFLDDVRSSNGQRVHCTCAEALETQRITCTVNQSVATGQVVSL